MISVFFVFALKKQKTNFHKSTAIKSIFHGKSIRLIYENKKEQ